MRRPHEDEIGGTGVVSVVSHAAVARQQGHVELALQDDTALIDRATRLGIRRGDRVDHRGCVGERCVGERSVGKGGVEDRPVGLQTVGARVGHERIGERRVVRTIDRWKTVDEHVCIGPCVTDQVGRSTPAAHQEPDQQDRKSHRGTA